MEKKISKGVIFVYNNGLKPFLKEITKQEVNDILLDKFMKTNLFDNVYTMFLFDFDKDYFVYVSIDTKLYPNHISYFQFLNLTKKLDLPNIGTNILKKRIEEINLKLFSIFKNKRLYYIEYPESENEDYVTVNLHNIIKWEPDEKFLAKYRSDDEEYMDMKSDTDYWIPNEDDYNFVENKLKSVFGDDVELDYTEKLHLFCTIKI